MSNFENNFADIMCPVMNSLHNPSTAFVQTSESYSIKSNQNEYKNNNNIPYDQVMMLKLTLFELYFQFEHLLADLYHRLV